MSIKKLISQTATYGMTTIITRFFSYILTPYFTYLSLFSESMYGVMSYYYTVIPFGLTFLTLGFETGYFRFIGKSASEEDKKRLFNSLSTFISLLSILFFVVITLFSDNIYSALGADKAGDIKIIPIVAAIIALDAITSLPFARLRAQGRVKRFMVVKVTNVLVYLLLSIFFYSALPYLSSKGILSSLWNESFGVGYVFVANLAASIITLLQLSRNIEGFRVNIDKKVVKSVFLFSLPLFISSFSGTANEFADRQMIYFLLPDSEATYQLGIYSAIMKLGAFIYLFTQMYRFAAEPYFLSEVKSSEFKDRNAEALKYFTIASLAIFLFINLYIDYFQYFIGDKYRIGLPIVPIVLGSNLLFGVYVNLSYWYKVEEKTFIAIFISFAGLAVTILLNFLLIPKLGYAGSAWSRLGCYGFIVIISYILNQKYMKTPYDIKSIGKYTALTLILFALFNFIKFESLVVETIIATLFFIIFVAYFAYEERVLQRLRGRKR
ncbi:MAG: oligosaccharide flippase family protein [Rikenellaceae bacterium]